MALYTDFAHHGTVDTAVLNFADCVQVGTLDSIVLLIQVCGSQAGIVVGEVGIDQHKHHAGYYLELVYRTW
jgi:hypothetical protein